MDKLLDIQSRRVWVWTWWTISAWCAILSAFLFSSAATPKRSLPVSFCRFRFPYAAHTYHIFWTLPGSHLSRLLPRLRWDPRYCLTSIHFAYITCSYCIVSQVHIEYSRLLPRLSYCIVSHKTHWYSISLYSRMCWREESYTTLCPDYGTNSWYHD